MSEPPSESSRISKLLGLASSGDADALGKVFEAAYPELHALASSRLRARGRAPDTLQTTVIVHETFMRFAQLGELQAEHRGQFFRYAGHVMRSVIVDTVRRRVAQRRGSGAEHVALTDSEGGVELGGEEEILEVHAALDSLAQTEPRLVDVVQLRYFGGMTDAEIANALGVTDRTVRRDWEKARLLLSEALAAGER